SLADGDAVLAAIARLAILGVRAVHGLRDEARDGRLSRATNACQQVRVRDLPARDRVPQRPRDVLLSDDRAERLGTVAAVESGALRHRSRIDAGGVGGAAAIDCGRAPSVDGDLQVARARAPSRLALVPTRSLRSPVRRTHARTTRRDEHPAFSTVPPRARAPLERDRTLSLPPRCRRGTTGADLLHRRRPGRRLRAR